MRHIRQQDNTFILVDPAVRTSKSRTIDLHMHLGILDSRAKMLKQKLQIQVNKMFPLNTRNMKMRTKKPAPH
jgi:hypothetical protein